MFTHHLTSDMLFDHSPCTIDLDAFEEEWPDGVDLTLPVLKRASDLHLDLFWFASHFLIPHNHRRYNDFVELLWDRYFNDPTLECIPYLRTLAIRSMFRASNRYLAKLLNIPLE